MNILDIGEHKLSIKATLILIITAFIFSISCRMIWIYQFQNTESFKWHNQLMINTNDGYFYAKGAKDILNNDHTDKRSPTNNIVSKLTAFFTKILPFSLETVILYMPVFLSSLIVIPLILMGRSIGNTYLGGISAFIGSIIWSYYNRTMAGYYDTDMLNIVIPLFMILGFFLYVNNKHLRYILISAISIIVYQDWYSASFSLTFASIVVFSIFIIIQDRKNLQNYLAISLVLFSMANIPIMLKILLLVLIYGIFHFFKQKILKYSIIILLASFVLLFSVGGLDPIWSNIKLYIFRESISGDTENIKLHFFAVTKTVREAGKIPFNVFADRISGNPSLFVLSLIGYLIMIIRYPIMLLFLPMVGLGFIAQKAGLRFTIYAIPPLAMGFSYLAMLVSKLVSQFFSKEKKVFFQSIIVALFVAVSLYVNIEHIVRYRVPTVFTKQEVEILDKLGKIAKKGDYVVTWWDYGYPIMFYSNINTLIDGGLHSGNLNFPVSFILTHDQVSAYNMAKLDVAYTIKKEKQHFDSTLIEEMRDYGFKDVNDFLSALKSKNFKAPKTKRDIFLYLPDRMLNIFPTIAIFSNIDLNTGERLPSSFFYVTNRFKNTKDSIILGRDMRLIKSKGELQVGDKKIRIHRFVVVGYNRSGQLQKKISIIDSQSPIDIIYMESYHRFIVLSDKMYNSTYIQLYVLENYDKSLYKPVILNPYAKVYRLR